MYEFVNPYNFVPFGSDLDESKKADKREYYRGEKQKELLSGWLHVNMELKTPLIIPDGAHPDYWPGTFQEKKGEKSGELLYNPAKKKYEPSMPLDMLKEMKEKAHLKYPFFKQYNPESRKEEYAVPGSEIRGMIRSAYEAVTNSCMPFLMDNKKTSQRVPLFGALHKRGLLGYDGKKWVLYKTEVELEEVIVFPLYKINGHYYVPSLESVKNNEDNKKKNKDGTYKYKIMRVLNEVPDETDKALNDAFQAEEYDGNKKIRYGVTITRGYGKNKWNVSDGEEKIEIDKDGNVETYFFVRINVDGENANKVDVSWINKKPGEEDNRGVLQYNVPVNLSRIYHVAYLKKAVSAEDGATIFDTEKVWPESGAEENEEAYKKLLSALQRDGTERYKKGKRVNKQPNKECNEALEKALKEACKDPNQLVPVYYFGVKTGAGGENDKEVYMSGSAAGRIAQRRKWEDIFGGHLPCRGNRFCPACLLFGTSSDDDEYGMKGHVRFSDAFLSSPVEGKITNLHTLPILATPKSTAFEFYLRRPMEDVIYWNYDFYEKKEDKDKGTKNEFYHLPKATPRGRKMYWHHKHSLPDGYGKSNDCKKSKMNCTAEVMNAGKTFSFDVYFDQITGIQLKELIWVITLGENQSDSNLQHKLGHAKPLGYGSVKLIIDKEKSMIREFKLAEGGACRYMIRSFAKSKEFGGDSIETPFDSDVETVKSFLIMCNTHTIEDKIKIDYPRMKAGGEIFKWFGKNRENASRLKTLPYPWEEAYLDSNYEEEIETMDSEEEEEEKGVVWVGDYDLTYDQEKRLAEAGHLKVSVRKKNKGSVGEALTKYADEKYGAVALSYDIKNEDQKRAKELFAHVWVSKRKQAKGKDIGWIRLK